MLPADWLFHSCLSLYAYFYNLSNINIVIIIIIINVIVAIVVVIHIYKKYDKTHNSVDYIKFGSKTRQDINKAGWIEGSKKKKHLKYCIGKIPWRKNAGIVSHTIHRHTHTLTLTHTFSLRRHSIPLSSTAQSNHASVWNILS